MSTNLPPIQKRFNQLRGLATAHLVMGSLWIPFGLIVSYFITCVILVARQGNEPGLNVSMSTFLESRPSVAMVFIALFTLIPALLWIASGFCILRSKARWLSILVALFSCVVFPVGTILGVITLITFSRKEASTEV